MHAPVHHPRPAEPSPGERSGGSQPRAVMTYTHMPRSLGLMEKTLVSQWESPRCGTVCVFLLPEVKSHPSHGTLWRNAQKNSKRGQQVTQYQDHCIHQPDTAETFCDALRSAMRGTASPPHPLLPPPPAPRPPVSSTKPVLRAERGAVNRTRWRHIKPCISTEDVWPG